MKAVRLHKAGDLRVEDIPIPKISDDEVLVKVLMCGVCGSDIPRVLFYGAHIAPLTIGHEFAGEIIETGKNVTGFKQGDRVTVPPLIPCYKCEWCQKGLYSLCSDYSYFGSRRDGAMAEYVAVPKENLLKLKDNIKTIDAATADPCANALHALCLADMQPGKSVCIYGAGPIGLYAVQCAKALGAGVVISVDINEKKTDIAKKSGADHVVNAKLEDAVKTVREITNGGAEIVLDITGSPAAQKNCIQSATKTGKVMFVGISHKGLDLSEKDVDCIMRNQISVIGSWNTFTSPFPGKDWFGALELFDQNKISSEFMVSHQLPFEEAPEMFEKIKKRDVFFNKILFLPSKQRNQTYATKH